MSYKATIGLEIHAELKTKTKMFCDCPNNPFASEPNVNVCPICMAHPGTLPVINKKAVESVLRVGVAIGGNLADFTEFDRKNYFYPDIPKGFQISQYKYPLVSGGSINGVTITRIHLEEDTASSLHEEGDFSLVDYNRAGVPLLELVTDPVIHSAEEAGNFGRELQLLLRTLGVSEANMEKGEMRVEVNLSVSQTEKFGTKVEIKNLNSFKVVEKAIAYEITRHIEVLEEGGTIIQETRGWDDAGNKTFSQRAKENSHDYRYFPEPDLPKLKISEIPAFSLENLKQSLPELPQQKRARYASLGLKPQDIEVYVSLPEVSQFFEKAGASLLASNYIVSDLLGLIKKKYGEGKEYMIGQLLFTADDFAILMRMIEEGKLSSRGAKDILSMMFEKGGKPDVLAVEHDLIQKNDVGELKKVVQEVLDENPKVVADYKAGKESLFMFFVGQAMKKTKGSANPAQLQVILKELLG